MTQDKTEIEKKPFPDPLIRAKLIVLQSDRDREDALEVAEFLDAQEAKIQSLEAEIERLNKESEKDEAERAQLANELFKLKEYNTRLLDENIKLSNELNLPTDPVERAKVLEIINADYEAKEVKEGGK